MVRREPFSGVEMLERMSSDVATADEVTDKEQSLLLLNQLTPWSSYDNVPITIEISGRLRWWPLQEAVNGLVRRHPALRTVFSVTDDTFQKTVLPPARVEVEVEMSSGAAGLGEFIDRPFTLDGRPLIRVGLFRDETDTLCVTVHHLVFDAPSAYIVLRELVAMYEQLCHQDALPPTMTAPALRLPESRPSEAGKAYWRRHLDGAPFGSTRMPFTVREPAGGQPVAATIDRPVPDEVRDATNGLRRELRVTDNIVFMAAFYALLTRHGMGTDLVIGVPLNMRDAKHGDSVGYHTNTIALRTVLDRRQGFRTLAHDVRNTFLTGLAHADVTVDSINSVLRSTADIWRHGPFRYLFNYLPVTTPQSLSVDGMPARTINSAARSSRYDLEFFVLVGESSSRIRVIYNTSIHSAIEIEHLIDRYLALVRSAAEQPDVPIAALHLEAKRAGEDRVVVDETGQRLPAGVWGRLCANDSGASTNDIARIAWDGRIEVAKGHGDTSAPAASLDPTSSGEPEGGAHLSAVLTLWREVLDQPGLDADTDFFAAGGQSLLAVRLLERTGRRLGFRIPLDTLISAPTPRSFAARLTALQHDSN
jgi:Condensation domain/Phosphopantetheine attachment site